MVFAALEATIDLHLRKATKELPVLHLLSLPTEQLRARAEVFIDHLQSLPCELRIGESQIEVGGGALPRAQLESVTLEISDSQYSPNELAALLRDQTPPVIGYVANHRFKLDLRTIFPQQDDLVVAALRRCLTT